MKTRLILSSITLFIYLAFLRLYSLVESPVAGVVTANQLNDTVSAHVIAKSIREGDIQAGALILLIVTFVVIWFGYFFPKTPKSVDIL